MRIETAHPRELGSGEVALWRAHMRASESLRSPYFTPEWAKLIGEAREDARVCIVAGGRGFMGVQRVSRFAAMGLGAPIADYQGLVGEPGLAVDGAAICRALKVGRIDLTHVPAGQPVLAEPAGGEGSWIAEVSGGKDLYLAALKLRRGEFLRQSDKKQRKLERERGQLEFRAVSAEAADFQTLLKWKNAQLARSGQPEIWNRPWVRDVLERSFAARDHAFSGALFTLGVDGRRAAAAYFLRADRVLHAWVVAHDDDFNSYSPGLLLARWAVSWAAENGFAEVDFGPGESQYKRQLSTGQRQLEWGAVAGLSWSAAIRRTQFALRAGMEKLPAPKLAALPGKAMRRLDLMRALAA